MSLFIEKYATQLGVKPRMPHISEHFFPIEYENYITIDATNSSTVNNYKNWDFVINQLKNFLPNHNIVQVGLDKEFTLQSCDKKISNLCTLKHVFHVIKNSSLHMGIDCVSSHIAAYYKIPTVTLYSKYPSGYTKPIYSDDENYVALDSSIDGFKYTFSDQESSDRINKIPPEKIISESLRLLGINNNYNKYETINIGKLFSSPVIEVVPNFDGSNQSSFSKIVNLRFDYTEDRTYTESWLNKKCNLLMDSPIDIDLIVSFRENIKGATIFMGENTFSEKYLSILKELNIPVRLTCRDKKNISKIRLKYFDWNINQYKIINKKDLDFHKDICDNTYYYSNKILMSEGKNYSSKAALEEGLEREEGKYEKVIDSPSFWEEVEHFNIYRYA